MKLIYQGVDIYPEVSINSAFTKCMRKKERHPEIRFNDTKGLWIDGTLCREIS